MSLRRPVIAWAEAATALGGLSATFAGLMAGKCGLSPVTRFETPPHLSNLAGCVPGLVEESGEADSMLPALLSRVLADAPLEGLSALMAATTKSGVDALERSTATGAPLPKPAELEAPAELAAEILQFPGPRETVSAACVSSTLALGRAAKMVAHGLAEAVLVVGVDLVSRFVHAGFACLGAMATGPCRPFDARRTGLIAGEAAGALIVASEDFARSAGLPLLARVSGFGASGDAHHLSAPDPEAGGLIRAMRLALADAGRAPEEVGGVIGHGTGTVYNDLMELKAQAAVFGRRPPPLTSVKGAMGHAMGACGAVEAALCVRSLEAMQLPPTVGFEIPEQGAEACVSAAPQKISSPVVMTTNSGFGGANAALVIEGVGS